MAVNYIEDFDFSKLENYTEGGALKPSPDQYVGKLIINNNKAILEPYERDSIIYNNMEYSYESKETYLDQNVLIILESPHRFEYDDNNNPVGLAMGKTGENLFSLFTSALKESKMFMKDGAYNVILTNAIQYQTSCGLNPIDRKLRDKNWLDIYDNYGGEEDFRKRIYTIKPRYTFNLCTGGRNPEGLRAKVTASLIKFKLKKGKHFTEGNHPASWDLRGDTRNAIIY